MPQLSKRQLIIIGGVLLVLLVFGAAFVFGRKPPANVEAVTLKVWGTESEENFDVLAKGYKALRTNVTIDYTEIPEAIYEERLIRGLASAEGPDVFFVKNRNLPLNLIVPSNQEWINSSEVSNGFPDAVVRDFTNGELVYALPLELDTLVLFYNKDILNQAGIVEPPKTWEELKNLVPSLRQVDQSGQLQRAAVALGGSTRSMASAPQILQTIMLQNGTQMLDSRGEADFAKDEGLEAMNFYMQFTNPSSEYYTWNDYGVDYLDAFASGRIGMIIDFSSAAARIKNKNPFLEFGMAALPQVTMEKAVNFADYYGLAVSKQSQEPGWAWDLVIRMTTDKDIQISYLTEAKSPPALKSLINSSIRDANYAVTSKQALTARSWHAAGGKNIDAALNSAIQRVISGAAVAKDSLSQAESQVSQILKSQ